MFFAFCENNRQKASIQDRLKKHLLGNSITGAIAVCVTSALIAPVSLYIGSKITNKIIPDNPISQLSYENYMDYGLQIHIFQCSYTIGKYDSAYFIPSLIGFFIAKQFTCKKLVGI